MPPLPCSTLVDSLKWRYATKVFDSTKIIAPETWQALEEALVLTPSSYGLQPWRFIVITDHEMKKQLRSHSWNQAQVTDCSHYVVFASLTKISEADIDAFMLRTAGVRGVTPESLAGFRKVVVKDVVHGPRGQASHEWAARQAYIALGNFMTCAALLQVDTCPMEGFAPAEYDRVLGLAERGLTAAVCCAAGHRGPSDKYAVLPKVRFASEHMIERI
jgi:nitroreductase